MFSIDWKNLQLNADKIRQEWEEAWAALDTLPSLNAETAVHTLGLLVKRTHLDIFEHFKDAGKVFPTRQCYEKRLAKVNNLWWVDHATAGINGWGTLDWFSSRFFKHVMPFNVEGDARAFATRKAKYKPTVTQEGHRWLVTWMGLAEACTHFIVFQDGTPFMLLPLDDACWGEPKRNGDAVQIEMVNALIVHRQAQEWHYWAGKIPSEMVAAQPPASLDKPFRGATHMQPYTLEQIIANIKIKRLCIAALHPRMAPARMSQHTDWRDSKYDMGPLWPFEMCNSAAFENYPIASYNFAQQLSAFGIKPPATTVTENATGAASPEVVHDLWEGDNTIDSTKEVQAALVKIYGPSVLPKYGVDGDLGPETTVAVKRFQVNWNRLNPHDRIDSDGIPGTETCQRLQKALAMGTRFVPI